MPRPFIPVSHAASFDFVYLAGSYYMVNRLHLVKSTDYSLADLQSAREVLVNWATSYWSQCFSRSVSIIRVRSKALDKQNAPFEDYTVNPPIAGGIDGVLMPLSVSFSIRMSSGLQGRSTRGRLYVPGIVINDVSGNNLTLSRADGIVSQLELLRELLIGDPKNGKLNIVSYRHNKAWRTTGQPYEVTSISYFDLRLDSQRRRLGKPNP